MLITGAMLPLTSYASYPTGYYDSLNGKCGAELKTAVKKMMYTHTVIAYGDKTWNAFLDTDVHEVDGQDCWWDMYSDNNVTVESGHSSLNIEHSIANSWWGHTKNDAYKDIVHLNPSDATANNRKANYPFCELATVTWDNGVTFVGTPKTGLGGGSSKGYEPHDMYKGDFARVCFYMFCVYADDPNTSWASNTAWMYDTSSTLMLQPWAQTMLLRWASNDPVSEKEQQRNDGIYKHQRNRNPFIDLPDLADHIWGDKSSEPYVVEDAGEPNDPDEPNPDTDNYNWLSENDSDEGDWTFENVSLPDGSSYVWSWKIYSSLGYLNGSGFIGSAKACEAYAWSPAVDFANVRTAKFSFDQAAKYQTTMADLCRVAVRDVDSGEITEFELAALPTSGSWTFTNSGEYDLAQFSGKHVQIGFKYKSTTSGADTWEIRNAELKLTRTLSGIEQIAEPEEYDEADEVGVFGNNILVPEGASIFDLNGRRVEGSNLAPGVYLVVKSTFKQNLKIVIR